MWFKQTDNHKQEMCSLVAKCVQQLSFGGNVCIHAVSLLIRFVGLPALAAVFGIVSSDCSSYNIQLLTDVSGDTE
jgi:hypothetical protein